MCSPGDDDNQSPPVEALISSETKPSLLRPRLNAMYIHIWTYGYIYAYIHISKYIELYIHLVIMTISVSKIFDLFRN